jgi:hypothetical protein
MAACRAAAWRHLIAQIDQIGVASILISAELTTKQIGAWSARRSASL